MIIQLKKIKLTSYTLLKMKKIGILRVLGILLITFGIVYLDFDNLNFDLNYKAYAALIIGLIISVFSYLKPQKSETEY